MIDKDVNDLLMSDYGQLENTVEQEQHIFWGFSILTVPYHQDIFLATFFSFDEC